MSQFDNIESIYLPIPNEPDLRDYLSIPDHTSSPPSEIDYQDIHTISDSESDIVEEVSESQFTDQTVRPPTRQALEPPTQLVNSKPVNTNIIPPSIPSPTNTMSMTPIGTLPARFTKGAPAKFKGRSSEVHDFLDQYEDLCTIRKITSDHDKVRGLWRYCSCEVKGYLEVQTEYITPDWDQLKAKIIKMYDADKTRQFYNLHDVHQFALISSTKAISNIEEWHTYVCLYEARAGKLKLDGKINADQYNMYLWAGIETSLRKNTVDREMKQAYPSHDVTQFYTQAEIESVMEKLFAKDTANVHMLDPTAFGMHVARQYIPSDTSDSEIDEEESDDEFYRRKEPRVRRKRSLKRSGEDKKDRRYRRLQEEQTAKKDKKGKQTLTVRQEENEYQGTKDEVEELLEELNTFQTTDPAYGATYYKIVKADKTDSLRTWLAKPTPVSTSPVQSMPQQQLPRRNPYETQIVTRPVYQQSAGGPTGSNAIQPRSMNPQNGYTDPAFRKCYGCDQPGHRSGECPVMRQLQTEGKVDWTGTKWIMKNGAFIARINGESLSQAASRIANESIEPAKRVNFFSIVTKEEPTRVSEDIDRMEVDNDSRAPSRNRQQQVDRITLLTSSGRVPDKREASHSRNDPMDIASDSEMDWELDDESASDTDSELDYKIQYAADLESWTDEENDAEDERMDVDEEEENIWNNISSDTEIQPGEVVRIRDGRAFSIRHGIPPFSAYPALREPSAVARDARNKANDLSGVKYHQQRKQQETGEGLTLVEKQKLLHDARIAQKNLRAERQGQRDNRQDQDEANKENQS